MWQRFINELNFVFITAKMVQTWEWGRLNAWRMALTTVWLSILILNFFYAFFGSKLWCVQFSPSVEQKNQPSHVNLYVPIKISSVNRHTQKCKKAVIKFICVFSAIFHWCVRARAEHTSHIRSGGRWQQNQQNAFRLKRIAVKWSDKLLRWIRDRT